MAYPKRLLVPGEEVVLDLNPHWLFIFPHAVGLAVPCIVGIVALTQGWDLVAKVCGGLILLALLVFVPRVIKWQTTSFVVTSERCIYRSGIISHNGIEIPLERINTVFSNQTVFERLFGTGDLSIESGGETGRQEFSDIRKPERVQHAIITQKEAGENRMYDRIGQHAGQGITQAANRLSAAPSVPDQIAQLASLRDSGAITPEEFEAKKADLLDRM